jgi:hypothetical protein
VAIIGLVALAGTQRTGAVREQIPDQVGPLAARSTARDAGNQSRVLPGYQGQEPLAGFWRGCSEATLRGTYGVQIQGTRLAPSPPAPAGTVESVIGIIRRHYDGQGRFTQINNEKGSVSANGPVDREGFGTYVVNDDCSGSHELTIPGVPFPITDRFVIVDYGQEVRHFVVSPASVMVSGVARKVGFW